MAHMLLVHFSYRCKSCGWCESCQYGVASARGRCESCQCFVVSVCSKGVNCVSVFVEI